MPVTKVLIIPFYLILKKQFNPFLDSTHKCNIWSLRNELTAVLLKLFLNDQVKGALMCKYRQLTQEDRYHIYALKKLNFSHTYIAQEIGVHKATIGRELNRNIGKKGYRPKQAHQKALYRRKTATKSIKLTPDTVDLVEHMINQDFSPEQISGTLKKRYNLNLSHETVYQHILRDKKNGGQLYTHLRQSHRKRKKRYGSSNTRGIIKNRVCIDKRPHIVDLKTRLGDWEIDTVIGKNHKGAILTIVERKSKFTTIKKLENRKAATVSNATIELLRPYMDNVLTITSDNGKEFAYHTDISSELQADIYFAHPYHSWERGLNENTNGLIRQYFPKGMDFSSITDDQVDKVSDLLNNRPRKTLNFDTPNEQFLS